MRPALELAMAVVRSGRLQSPPVVPPRSLVPFLGFTRLPDRALRTVARALEESDELRERVATAPGGAEDVIGRAGWLYLNRPDGWEAELQQLAAQRGQGGGSTVLDVAPDRAAFERADAAEARLRSAAAEIERLRGELASVNETLDDERTARQRLDETVGELRARVRALESERDAAHRRVAAADAAVRAAEQARDRAERERDEARRELDGPREREEAARKAAAASAAHLDEAAHALREALGRLERLASDLGDDPPPERAVVRPAVDLPQPLPEARPDRMEGQRLPAALPPGLYEESAEVADHLVRLDRALLLVDGYNASLRLWSGMSLAEQRRRLVDALGELSARAGVSAIVVFDGAGDDPTSLSLPMRSGVQVRFSPAAREADDVILDLVDQTPLPRPVIVATNDQRVRREAASRGANVIDQTQLAGLLRRERP